MSYQTLDVEIDDRGVAYTTLNLPEKRNALSVQMMRELTGLAATTGQDPAVRAIVLAGAGKAFCAGGDLDWMMAQINADRETRMVEARRLAQTFKALNEMPTPLIGRIHGSAFGGATGLVSVCDVTVAETNARFSFSETRLGLIPATISPYVMARMGEGNARNVMMSARIFHAPEAVELGLVSKVCDQLDDAVEAEVAPYLSVAPGAVGAAKRLVRSLGIRIDTQVIDDTIRQLADSWEQPEARAGIDAFLKKEHPPWA